MGTDADGLPDFGNEHLEAGRQLKVYLRALKALVDAGGGGGGADDQSAAEVPFTPFGGVSSVDLQGALEEIISRPTVDYVQDTDPTLDDPNTVTAHRVWARLTDPKTYAVRNTANNAWVFFSDGGSGAGSGYGVGGFGTVPWDTTPVPSGASTGLSNGVLVPHFATVGWGRTINNHFFSPLNDLMDRVTVLEEA